MAEFPYLRVWTDALIGDTHHLTPAQFGAYFRLLMVAWRTKDCSLPNDDVFLGRAVGDPKNWHRLKPVVLPFFTLGGDNRYRQNRLLDERNYCSRTAARASAGGKANALKRLHRGSAKPELNEFLTPAPIPIPITKKERKKDSSQNCVLPETWNPTDRHYKTGQKKGLTTEQVNEMAIDMREWSLAGGKKKANWDIFFNIWMKNNYSGGVRNGNGNGTKRNGPAAIRSAIYETLDRAIEETRRGGVRADEGKIIDGSGAAVRKSGPDPLSSWPSGSLVALPKAGD